MARFISSTMALLCLLTGCKTGGETPTRTLPLLVPLPSGSGSHGTATPPEPRLEPLPAPAPNVGARRLPAHEVKVLAFNRRGDRLAAIEQLRVGWQIGVWDLASGAKLLEIPVTGATPQGQISWCFGDQAIWWHELVVGADFGQRSRIAVHRADDGHPLGVVDPAEYASCHQSSERLAVVEPARVTIWDASMRPVRTLAIKGSMGVAWHPRGLELAVSRYLSPEPSSHVDLWRVDGSAPYATHAFGDVSTVTVPLGYSRDGQNLAWAEHNRLGTGSKTIVLRRLDGTVVRSAAWRGFIDHLSFSPDGAWVMAGSTAMTMGVFDANDGSLAGSLPGMGAFSADSRTLAVLFADTSLRHFNLKALASKGIGAGRKVPLERRSLRHAIAVDPSHHWLALGDVQGIDIVAMP